MEAARARAMEDNYTRLAAAILEAAQETARAAGRPLAPVFARYGVTLTVTDPFALQAGLEGVIEDTGEDCRWCCAKL